MGVAKALLHPPARLRPIPDVTAAWLRRLWCLLFGIAVLTLVAGTLYVVRASYSIAPSIKSYGLDFDVITDGTLVVGTLARPGHESDVPITARVVAFNGTPVSPNLVVGDFAKMLDDAHGQPVSITLQQPDGRTVNLVQRHHEVRADPASARNRDLRVWMRLAAALFACGALLGCSALLAFRRPKDPVAMLFAFGFATIVMTVDPALQLWLWTDRSVIVDVVGAVFFYLLLLALATFPDGIFVPRFFRWLLPIGIPLAVLSSAPGLNEDIQGVATIAVLLGTLVSQIVRFRREPEGIVRQQLKWAGFGFAIGLLLVLAAFLLAASIPDNPNQQVPLVNLFVLLMFSSGMAAIALGLLVALTRFRLWEADTVITRSAAYAVVTLIVGVVWAASSDLVKLVIEQILGRESEAGATTVGAVIAAGIFSPTQSLVLGWTRKRFGGPIVRMRATVTRLKSWGLTETPHEVATRALAIIDSVIHPSAAAIVLDGPLERELVAARNATSENDPELIDRIELVDEVSPVGELLLGRRSDRNRYNRDQLAAVHELVPTLAEALRVARSHFSRENLMQQKLDEMAARLAQLEGGTPRTA
jgi:hypothetical protein